jgi:hypothetical protein
VTIVEYFGGKKSGEGVMGIKPSPPSNRDDLT